MGAREFLMVKKGKKTFAKSFRFRSVLSKNRVLLFGGDVGLARKLGKVFKNRDFVFRREKETHRVECFIREFSPSLILAACGGLPASIKLCAAVKCSKNFRHLPVVILEKKDGAGVNRNITKSLSAGAEDYITRPLDTELFIARIAVILRRMLFSSEPEEVIEASGISVNLTKHTVEVSSRAVKLTPKEFALLYFLMKRKGGVLTRNALMQNIWERKYFPNMRTIDIHVQSLRKKLGDSGKHIKAVEGIGYKFDA